MQLSFFILIKFCLMHEFVCFNRKIERAAKISVSAVSSAVLYGKGIFTSLTISKGKPFLWEKHWRRLIDNAERLRIDLSDFSQEIIKDSLAATIEKNNFTTGRARITFFDESAGKLWSFESLKRTSFLITTADLREAKKDWRVSVSRYLVNSTSPLANVKSCNYLENMLAFEEANGRGFDEAVRLNERGEIVSACLANIFWMKNEKLFTPSLKTGCLNGTTREFLTEKFEVAEVEQNLEVLESADAIFLTSSGIGIAQVAGFDKRKFERKFEKFTQNLFGK